MLFIKTIDVADNERAFLFKKNRFAGVLEPGRYRYFDVSGRMRVEKFDMTYSVLEHVLARFLVTTFSAITGDYLESFQLSDTEVGLLYKNEQLLEIITPGSFKVYWKGLEKIELKRLDIAEDY